MRRGLALGVAAAITAAVALAGENAYLGTIDAPADGGVATNASTSSPFAIPAGSKVTLDCDWEARVLTDRTTVGRSGASKGLRVPVTTLFPTSVGSAIGAIDGGAGTQARQTALIAVTSNDAGTAASCGVWLRSGTE